MNTQKGFAKPELPVEEIVQNLETCTLCGSKLRFTHRTNYLDLEVQEQVTCPCCGVKNNMASFILQ